MNQPSPPKPPPNPLTDFFWQGALEGVLRIQRCQQCHTYIHHPRPVCRSCQSFDLAPEAVSGHGSLYSFTVTYKAFHPFFVSRLPFVVASVELDEQPGLRLVSNVVGVPHEEVRIGMALQVQFEQLAPDFAIPVFAPAGAA
jgi:uncharacterized protein